MTIPEKYHTFRDLLLKKENPSEYQLSHPAICLKVLSDIFASSRLSPDDCKQLILILQHETSAYRVALADRLSPLVEPFLELNFYHDSELQRHIPPHEITANAFYAFWTILSYTHRQQNHLPPSLDLKNRFAYILKKARPDYLNLSFQNLDQCNLSFLEVDQADFRYASLEKAVLLHSKLPEANFHNCNLQEAILNSAHFPKAFFSFANLKKAQFLDANCHQTVFHGANLETAELSRCNLGQARLDQVNLQHADLTEASLTRAHIRRSDLAYTNLSKSTLYQADLRGSALHHATLYMTNFQEAQLEGMDWYDNAYFKTDFRKAVAGEAFLKNLPAGDCILDPLSQENS